ncbi:alpha/beta hydrolase [Trinickia dinghuensis]|uniref:Alpha/beta hydrolase n=1 Tax=Trinickia dinghuensis TaxID=2291023 RepID=A0A3D8K4Z2_9BURK|nr:alpha/beta hydrolase [Trinickia dinghuensis]RDV00281.1 alpha/beta hydrolase [Trinickia dinghuensis]
MQLDQALEAILTQAREAGVPDFADLPPPAARGVYRQILAANDVRPAAVAVSDEIAAGTSGSVPVRIYRPRQGASAGVIVYYHGGGYVLGDLDGYDSVCRQLCADSQATIVSVDYRLAPEHPFPAAVDDAWTALEWAAAHAGMLAGERAPIAVAGDSAGAVLATVVCLLARDRHGPAIVYQGLVYPAAGAGHFGESDSRRRYADGPTLTMRTVDFFNRCYFGSTQPPASELAAPLLADDCSRLPPALLQVATHDPLRDEALAYGARLRQAGNDVMVVEYHGLAHGFISMGGTVPAARLAQLQLAQALHTALRHHQAG